MRQIERKARRAGGGMPAQWLGPAGQRCKVAVGVASLEIAAAPDLGVHITHVHKGWLPLAARQTDAAGKLGRWRLRDQSNRATRGTLVFLMRS